MRIHPDDAAALDRLTWQTGCCDVDHRPAIVSVTRGGDLCRDCLAYALYLDRGCDRPLHPLGEATAGELEFVTAEEALRLRVAEANARSRGERP